MNDLETNIEREIRDALNQDGTFAERIQQPHPDQTSPMTVEREKFETQNDVGMPVTQPWTWALPMMQQTVLLTAMRGADTTAKYGVAKMLIRWLRRCILVSALDKCVLTNPYDEGGGSFTGPSYIRQRSPHDGAPDTTPWEQHMHVLVDEYLREIDSIPHHYHMHFMHAAEIVGYKHPDDYIKNWWQATYLRFCKDMHVLPEPPETMDKRLSDDRDAWLAHSDPATIA